MEGISLKMDKRREKMYRYIEETTYNSPKYKYKVINYFPKSPDDEASMFDHYFQHLPNEEILSTKPENKYFTYSYIKKTGVYFANFLKIYEEVKQESQLYQSIPEDYFINKTTNVKEKKHVFCPKYLVCLSKHPFFISFKSILEEIYNHSFNPSSDIKTESILSFLLFRVSLPKYYDTQVSFVINNKMFQFNNNITYSEVSLKLLFTLLSIENIVKLFFGILTNSTIIFAHSKIEIITPIIYSLLSFILPFPNNYSIIPNLTHNLLEMLDYPIYFIAGIYKQDFGDIDIIIRKFSINKISYVICDIDNNGIISYLNESNYEEIKALEDTLIKKLSKLSNLYESINKSVNQKSPSNNTNSVNLWKQIQFDFFDKIQFHNYVINHQKKKNIVEVDGKNQGKIFKENKIRALFLDFIVSWFEFYDDSKHLNFDQKNNIFNTQLFINDAKIEYRTLLKIIVKLPYFDIFISNLIEYKFPEKMKITTQKKKKDDKVFLKIENFEVRYEVFNRALEKRKNNKSLSVIFKHNINHTISLPNVCPEMINFKQHPIFENKVYDLLFRHWNYLRFDNNKFNFSFIYLRQEKTRLYRSSYGINQNKGLLEEFSRIYREKFVLFNRFLGINAPRSDNNEKKNSSRSLSSQRQIKKFDVKDDDSSKYRDIITKEEYLKYFNEYCLQNKKKEFNLNYEFNINFGSNIIQTTSKCTLCKAPNSLWEIRRNIRFSKNKQESKVMCKNCKKSFVAHFIIIDAEDEENPIDITETYISELTNINIQFEHKYSPHFDKAANKKKYEKIEYMSTEQIMFNIQKNNKLYQSQTNDGKSNKYSVDKKLFISNKILKKLYPNLYYNLLLLFSDNKIRVSNKDDRILVFNIDEFIIDIKKRIKGEINTEDNYFILNETQIRPKDESLEMIRKKKILLENINKVHKIDLTVLKDEKKYDKFQKESQSILVKSQKMLLSLTNSNSQNLSKYLSKDQILYNTNNLIDMNSSVNSSNFFTKKSSNFDINSLNNFNRSKTRELILSHQTSKGEIEFNNFHMTDRNSLNNNEQIPVNNTNYNFFKQSSIGTYTDSQHLNNASGKRSSSIFGIDKPNLIIPIDYDNVPGKSRKGSRKSIQKYKDIFLKNAK